MGDPYRVEKSKPRPQQKQWKDMTPEERKAWCKYFQGRGPRPGSNPIKWDEAA